MWKEGGDPQGRSCKQEPGPAGSEWQIEEIGLYLQKMESHHQWLLSTGMTEVRPMSCS